MRNRWHLNLAAGAAGLFSLSFPSQVQAQCPPGGYGGSSNPGSPGNGPSAPAPRGYVPGDVTGPTTPGAAGPRTPGPIVPTPSPAGPTTGGRNVGAPLPVPATGGGSPGAPAPAGAATPGGAALPAGAARTGARGVVIEEDLTRWQYWWECNGDAFRVRPGAAGSAAQTGSDDFFLGNTRSARADDGMRASDQELTGTVLPALAAALAVDDHRELATSCLLAMAKIGRNGRDFALVDVFAAHLCHEEAAVREAAALAIGVAGIDGPRELGLLIALATDDGDGRRACRSANVDDRVRAFATYGLGLLAHRSSATATKFRAAKALVGLVEAPVLDRDVRVAAVSALGVLAPVIGRAGDTALRRMAFRALARFLASANGPGDAIAQAHCPIAMARLAGRDGDLSDACRTAFVAELDAAGQRRRSGAEIARSCALALGLVCRPHEDRDGLRSPDAACSERLLRTYADHSDQQTRCFAVIALGQIGGAENRRVLLREFAGARKAIEKPWCAIALGLLVRGAGAPDAVVVDALADAQRSGRNPELAGALAIGLGLAGGTGDGIRDRLDGAKGQDELAGNLCAGLALVQDRGAIGLLRQVERESVRRPPLLRDAGLALAQLGDTESCLELTAVLASRDGDPALLEAVGRVLAFVGDRRAIAPLVALLGSRDASRAARAGAAAALGGIGDRQDRPWREVYAQGANYRAAVATFLGGGAGVIDRQ